MINSLSIIFPIYNEEKRIHFTFKDIKKFNQKNNYIKLEYIFVDDGSKDNVINLISNFIKDNKSKNTNYKIIRLPTNQGKGFAIKQGIKHAKNQWILTIDADISVSLTQIKDWTKKKYLNKKIDIYFGSRNLKNSKVNTKVYRKLLGHIFSAILKLLFGIEFKDTQCGFKLYKKIVAKKIFSNVYDKGFVHDVEVTLISKKLKYKIKELPVKWTHKNDSKLNLLVDTIKMFIKLLFIKIKKS